MKRKTIALLLALMMCLALLSACGGNSSAGTKESPASENTSGPAGQKPADGKEEQPAQEPEQPEESEEPTQDEPEESEEPAPEETVLPEHEGTKFLALLQEEWNNGFFTGEGPKRTYYQYGWDSPILINGVVYIWDQMNKKVISYNIASKSLTENEIDLPNPYTNDFGPVLAINDTVYVLDNKTMEYDYNGTIRKTYARGELDVDFWQLGTSILLCFDKGYLYSKSQSLEDWSVYSYDFEKIADIPVPQREVEHGLKENVRLGGSKFAADGTVYASTNKGVNSEWYRLNTDTYEWEKYEGQPCTGYYFFGKYLSGDGGVYDRATGEQVFEYGELQPVRYFGGDKYLGYKDKEYRWMNLTDMSMSDPLPFPEKNDLYVLNDTYGVYKDKYGWFLWNYNTGEEETIVIFNQ